MRNETQELTIAELESVFGGMDVTIGNVGSNVTKAEDASLLSTEVLAQIVKVASQVVKHIPH
jgi:hypothetical protein